MALDMKNRREKIHADVRPLSIDIDGDKLNIVYRRSQTTVADTRKLNDLIRDAKQADSEEDSIRAAELNLSSLEKSHKEFLNTIVEWDLVNDGVPVPLTMQGLVEHEVDTDLMKFVTDAINEDQRPKKKTVKR